MNIMSTNTKRAGLFGCLIFPQNGVMHYGSEDPTHQLPMGAGVDTLHGHVETPKRPKNLDVAAVNGYASKNLREDSEDVDDGSLPCTPELHSDSEADVSYSAAGSEVLESDTRQLLSRYFSEFTGLSKTQRGESKPLSTMKRVVEDILAKHRYAYNGMINRLSMEERGGDLRFLQSVARTLFSDGSTNWGRIASLVAFGAVVCQHMREQGRPDCVELVGQEISTYLLSEQRDWLIKNNSWDGFVEFFHVADPESTVRNTLMAVAGFAGIGATLALLIR
ncbi:induced myeloid leukemia cell differentiation protein Mcl-1b [Salarias fasciatus]|uniref:induced myeloid leukemia cell differentiation protein Mcl-1b n=1 Tax=Salarias fasciatus TaxID=181472 RepID=UPI001176D41E|nr:induced myeloid leukemia cell differentiation protein Mcl-1-like [Salarias fasciatus]